MTFPSISDLIIPKKVLHVLTSLDFGGVESHIRIIAKNPEFTRFEHHFCAIRNGGAISEELLASGKKVAVLGVKSRIPSLSAIRDLIRLIHKKQPDILHTRGAEANFHGLIAGRICRVPVCIAEEIGFPNHSRKAQLAFRLIYRLADCVVAISEAVKCKLIDLGEVKPKRIYVLLNPTQMHSERAKPARPHLFKVGFVGRLEEVKNPLALVRAAGLLRDRGLSLKVTIVGDGSQRKMLEAEIVRLNLSEVVALTGFSPNPFELLLESSLYVQPSLSEGFGLALVEAMSAGIPVLTTAVGGAPEIITEGKNGWLLQSTDAEAVAERIGQLTSMTMDELQAIGIAGRASVVERFSPLAYFRKCDNLYDLMLERKTK